jgi:hexosaminidase
MKKYFWLFLVLSSILVTFSSCQQTSNEMENSIIPVPLKQEAHKGVFSVTPETKIVCSNQEGILKVAHYLAIAIGKYASFTPEVLTTDVVESGDHDIVLLLDTTCTDLNNEGYRLQVRRRGVEIHANQPVGLFYGVQSLLQLFPVSFFSGELTGAININGIQVVDEPRFSYRGMHLDVCRHMFPVSFIKEYIDMLAMYKFNTFHWHLTEDQGWRLEINQYPKLTEIGAFRDSTIVGHAGVRPEVYDGKPYGGFYTQDEVREIVQYASDRMITIIPEIELPGHSLAALAAYPELACTEGPFQVATTWGVFEDIYCPKEETFTFLENVLTEVMELFPGTYIHIGGDEAPKKRWEESAFCQNLMKKEGLKDEHELQSYFIQRIETFLNSHGRKLIGWDEILEGGLSPNATVMSWRGTEGGIAAAQQGHDAIMTPGSHCYFDHYQADPETQPLAIGGFTPLEKVYGYEPVPEELSAEEAQHILGAQANVWTEYITTPEQVEYMVLPRMAALAEVNWSQPTNKNYEDFQTRMTYHFDVYAALGYNYCPVANSLAQE